MGQGANGTTVLEVDDLSVEVSIRGTWVKALRDVPIRLSTLDGAKPVGAIEGGGEVYVMETIVGWSSVLPRALNLLPGGDRSF